MNPTLLETGLAILGVVTLLETFRFWRRKRREDNESPRGVGISLLVPFRTDFAEREANWVWLEQYWRHELPGAEIIIGADDSVPFCKTAAVNNAAAIADGDVYVILDADCYISGEVVEDCAQQIRDARNYGQPLWFVPYRHFWRLNAEATEEILCSDPEEPIRPCGHDSSILDGGEESESHGHWFGALIQIMPREAFEGVGGMDERFSGWGGEDVSFMRAVDTLYGKHKTTRNGVFHLWHPKLTAPNRQRLWEGQLEPRRNGHLAQRYRDALGDRARMRRLADERDEDLCPEAFE